MHLLGHSFSSSGRYFLPHFCYQFLFHYMTICFLKNCLFKRNFDIQNLVILNVMMRRPRSMWSYFSIFHWRIIPAMDYASPASYVSIKGRNYGLQLGFYLFNYVQNWVCFQNTVKTWVLLHSILTKSIHFNEY